MKEILERIVPTLRSLGFKGSGRNYKKVNPGAVMVINFQKSRSGDRFYVNLGVQPLCLPLSGGREGNPATASEPECTFRNRVPTPEGYGWPYDMQPHTLELLCSRLVDAYDEYLLPLATIPGPLTELTPEQLTGPVLPFGGGQGFDPLNFARINLAMGNLARAQAFVAIGLADCPPNATGYKWLLNDVLSEITAAEQNV